MNEELRQKLKGTIEEAITNFFYNKEVKVTHVLDRIFPAERRIRSLIGGLETSIGTTIWEPIARLLAKHNGFSQVENKLLMPSPFPPSLYETLNECRRLRENRASRLHMEECVRRLKEKAASIDRGGLTYVKPPPGKGVDIYLAKGGREYAFDIKTVQINQSGGLSLNLQLLEWYAYRFCRDPSVDFEARIAFPFNPFPRDWWEANGGRAYPLEKGKDAWVQEEFWSFLSGEQDTWKEIVNVFDELGAEGFGARFDNIFRQDALS